jgi:hypothetical protein
LMRRTAPPEHQIRRNTCILPFQTA